MEVAGFAGVVGVAGCGGCCRVWWVLQELFTEIKKSFFSFFTLTPALTPTLTLPAGKYTVRVSIYRI